MRSGVCVASCPNADDAKDPTWWTTNCKENTGAKCPTGTQENYDGFPFITYCIPNPTSENQDFLTKLKNKFLDSEAGAAF